MTTIFFKIGCQGALFFGKISSSFKVVVGTRSLVEDKRVGVNRLRYILE